MESLLCRRQNKIDFLTQLRNKNTEMTTQEGNSYEQNSSEYDSEETNSGPKAEELVEINKAIWFADEKDYWQTAILLEKGAALGDFMCKFKLASWLESIDPSKSIALFEELLTTPELSFDDNSHIHFHLGKLYMSRYNWVVAYKHFSSAYGICDAKIAMGILKHFGLVGIPDTGTAVQCFEEAARRYHYSEKELREICERFSSEFKKQQEQEQMIKMQAAEIESQRLKIEYLERQLKYYTSLAKK
jgi:hypothetical protein